MKNILKLGVFGILSLFILNFTSPSLANNDQNIDILLEKIFEKIEKTCLNDINDCDLTIDYNNQNNNYNNTNNNNNNNNQSTNNTDVVNNKTNDELKDSVELLHSLKVTSFGTKDKFMPYKNIRRDEAAKMYLQFAKNNMKILKKLSKNQKSVNQCKFNDSYKAWPDIQPMLTQSCQLNLFKGSNGSFNPKNQITKGQAIIVLIRMIDGYQSETGVSHYAENYYKRANQLGLLKGLGIGMYNIDSPANRGEIAKILYRAYNK